MELLFTFELGKIKFFFEDSQNLIIITERIQTKKKNQFFSALFHKKKKIYIHMTY